MSKGICYFVAVLALNACALMAPQIQPIAVYTQCTDSTPTKDAIIGGESVSLGDPDQKLVTLLKIRRASHESICTGTLISHRIILTAAHCITDVHPSNITAIFKTTSGCPVNHVRNWTTTASIKVIHKNFDGTPQSQSDIALLYLKNDPPYEQQRVPLIANNEKPSSDRLLLIGFGVTGEDKTDSQILRRVYKNLKKDIINRERALFVDQRRTPSGFCRGDSGAPIIAEMWGEPVILAINSANIGINTETQCQSFSLALDITYFTDWIQKNKEQLENSTWIGRLFSASTIIN